MRESSEACGISMSTAFAWRHRILDALHEVTENVCLDGVVEADETFFNVSYKGNHRAFTLPRKPHKRGSAVHTKGLSSEKVCVPCAINEGGVSYAEPAKLGKVSSDCIAKVLGGVIPPGAVLCTDNERAYLRFAGERGIGLVQMDTDSRTTEKDGKRYGIQRVNAYHSRLKGFLQRFHGVSTKYLGNYLVWNNFLENNRRGREDILSTMLSQITTIRMTLRNRDISKRPPVPCAA